MELKSLSEHESANKGDRTYVWSRSVDGNREFHLGRRYEQ